MKAQNLKVRLQSGLTQFQWNRAGVLNHDLQERVSGVGKEVHARARVR